LFSDEIFIPDLAFEQVLKESFMVELAADFAVVDGARQITDVSGAMRQNLLFDEVF